MKLPMQSKTLDMVLINYGGVFDGEVDSVTAGDVITIRDDNNVTLGLNVYGVKQFVTKGDMIKVIKVDDGYIMKLLDVLAKEVKE